MDPALKVALVYVIPSTILGLLTVILTWVAIHRVSEIRLTMNGRLDQLLSASIAVGRQHERDSHMVTVPGIPGTSSKGTS